MRGGDEVDNWVDEVNLVDNLVDNLLDNLVDNLVENLVDNLVNRWRFKKLTSWQGRRSENAASQVAQEGTGVGAQGERSWHFLLQKRFRIPLQKLLFSAAKKVSQQLFFSSPIYSQWADRAGETGAKVLNINYATH